MTLQELIATLDDCNITILEEGKPETPLVKAEYLVHDWDEDEEREMNSFEILPWYEDLKDRVVLHVSDQSPDGREKIVYLEEILPEVSKEELKEMIKKMDPDSVLTVRA